MKYVRSTKGLPRTAEFAMALAGLIFLSPLLAICALLVRLSSPGSVFFLQKRVGLNGRDFTLYKFRTMRASQNDGLKITASGDARITLIGKCLRKFKLDELPQLYNILRGEMSFVGPRPEVPDFVDLENPQWVEILSVRPGITDPVTLRLRNEEELLAGVRDKQAFYKDVLQPFKLKGYLIYVRTKSAAGDLKIIFLTVKAAVFPKTVPPPSVDEIQLSFVK